MRGGFFLRKRPLSSLAFPLQQLENRYSWDGVTGSVRFAKLGLGCKSDESRFRAISGIEPVMKTSVESCGLDIHAETISSYGIPAREATIP